MSLIQRLEYGKTKDGKPFLERIVIDIFIPSDFPEKYHKTIVKVADQCAVKNTILNPPKFEIKTTIKKAKEFRN